MTDEHWQRVADLYQAAQERSPEERLTFVRQASSGDSDLRREVELLLAQDANTNVIDRPIAAAANSLLADNAPDGPRFYDASRTGASCAPWSHPNVIAERRCTT
jgi:hypothetical protein